METQTLDDDNTSTMFDDIDVPNENTKKEAIINNFKEATAPVATESTKGEKKRLYMGGSTNDEHVSSITKLEREIRKLRLENEKLRLINTKKIESLHKGDVAIESSSVNKLLHNDHSETRSPTDTIVKKA